MTIKKIRPLFNQIVTTMDRHSIDEGEEFISDKQGTKAIKEYQKVVAIGSAIREIEVGDIVMINPKNYMVRKFKDGSIKNDFINQEEVIGYNFNIVLISEVPHLIITDRDVEYIIEEMEE